MFKFDFIIFVDGKIFHLVPSTNLKMCQHLSACGHHVQKHLLNEINCISHESSPVEYYNVYPFTDLVVILLSFISKFESPSYLTDLGTKHHAALHSCLNYADNYSAEICVWDQKLALVIIL